MSGVDIAGLRARIGEEFDGELHLSEDEANVLLDALLAQAAELAEARGKQREGAAACLTVAELVALIPLRDTLAAAGTCKDFIAYFKRALAERDEALAALKASEEREEGLLASLIWMVANDETNEGDTPMPEHGGRSWDEINAYWIDGLNRAREAIAKSQPALGSRPNLADATNNPPSDPGTEQREAGV